MQAHSVITRAEVDVPEDARVFLYAGVLNSRKNIVWLIENFVQCHENDEYMLVLGSGEKKQSAKQKRMIIYGCWDFRQTRLLT